MTIQEASHDNTRENDDEGALMLKKIDKLIGYYVTIIINNS
jgi:hypothetical protein